MILEAIVFSILTGLCIILGYTTFNLLRKNEKLEDITLSYRDYLKKLKQQISITDERLKEIDAKGTFDSDDEIGWFFKSIKELQNKINQFKIDI